MNFTLGADPEIFLIDKSRKFISSVGRIGGTKEMPMPLPLGPGFAVQEDNVAIEFNIPPSASVNLFSENISKAVGYLAFTVDGQGLSFSENSAQVFDEDQLQTPESQEFGCDPDFNAWADGARNPRPKATNGRLRTCGGHVHVGYDGEVSHLQLIKFMDLFLSVPAVFMDKGELRKELYGKAGAFRKKPYGVEYRTMSNFWIFKEDLHRWVWRNTQRAMEATLNNVKLGEETGKEIVAAINGNNKEIAAKLHKEFNLEVLS